MYLTVTLYLHYILVTFDVSLEGHIHVGPKDNLTNRHISSELLLAKKNVSKNAEFTGIRKVQDNIASTSKKFRRVERNVENDAKMIYNLSKSASDLCPYSDFCHLNSSELSDSLSHGVSCCKNCYCDVDCGERMDCCFDFLDEVKLKEKYNMKCVKPLIERTERVFTYTQSYFMIDSCLNNASFVCKNETSALWGSLFPVYSPLSKLIYINKHCAECNGFNDAIPWDVYINCNVSDGISGAGLIDSLRRGRCSLKFRPTDVAGVKPFACSEAVISSCDTNETLGDSDHALKEACAITRAEVFEFAGGGIKTYANAFCKLCNGIEHSPQDVCNALDDSIKTISVSLTTLVDWKVVSSFLNHEAPDFHQVDGTGYCKENEIRHPYESICRTISCPNSAIRTPEGCVVYSKTWYQAGYLIHLILTPISEDYIPTLTFIGTTHQNDQNVGQWLDSRGIRVDSIDVSAELEDKHNVSYIRSLNMIIGEKINTPLDSENLLETVKGSLKRRWRIRLDGKKYYFAVQFDQYLYFIQNGRMRRTHVLAKTNLSVLQPKRYEYIYENRKMIPPFYITKLFFCEQVTLLSEEWIPDYQGLRLNLTGTGNGSFLGDAEFNLRYKSDGTWQVQICLEDFKAELSRDATSMTANLCQKTLRLRLLFISVMAIILNIPVEL